MAFASEHNSSIPKDIRLRCFEKFNIIPNFNVPDICGQIEHTAVYVEPLQQPLLSTTQVAP
jgi:methyltransferase-like protein